MAEFHNLEVGKVGLVQETKEGRIVQIGLTPAQSEMLQMFLASVSKESPLIQLSNEYDLVLKSNFL